MLRILRFLRRQPGLEKVRITSVAGETGVRETYRIVGRYEITADDYLSGRVFVDSVCYSYWMIDTHNNDKNKSYLGYLEKDKVATVPYRALLPEGVDDLIVAGRAVSSDHRANGALRVQMTCMATGQVAGEAAALAVKSGCRAHEVDLAQLRQRLSASGAIVPEPNRPGTDSIEVVTAAGTIRITGLWYNSPHGETPDHRGRRDDPYASGNGADGRRV